MESIFWPPNSFYNFLLTSPLTKSTFWWRKINLIFCPTDSLKSGLCMLLACSAPETIFASTPHNITSWYLTTLVLRNFWANFFGPMGPNFEFFGPNTQCGTNSDPCRVSLDSIWPPSSCRPCLPWRNFCCITINFAEVWLTHYFIITEKQCPITMLLSPWMDWLGDKARCQKSWKGKNVSVTIPEANEGTWVVLCVEIMSMEVHPILEDRLEASAAALTLSQVRCCHMFFP